MQIVPKEELLEDIKSVYKKYGRYPSKRFYEKEGKYSVTTIERRFGSYSSALKKIGIEIKKHGHYLPRLNAPELYIKNYNDFIQLDGINKAIIAFDPHIPYHDVDLINEMLEFAEKGSFKTLIIGGDFIDFKGLYRKETQFIKIDWTEEIEEAVKVLNTLNDFFNNIYIIMGNHDWRLVRLLGNHEMSQRLLNLIFNVDKIHFTKYYFLTINGWLAVIHKGNSKNKLSKLEKIVNVHRMSVITGHSHRFAFGVHDSGIEIIGEGLHLTDPKKHEYASLELKDFSKWIKGWWVFDNDRVYPVVKHKNIYNYAKEAL